MEKKFKLTELLKTNTCLVNNPNAEELFRIDQLLSFLNETLSDYPDPIIVTSGFRSEAVNKQVGGVPGSHHRLGYAVDLTTKDINKLLEVLKDKIDLLDQLIYYPKKNFIHVSIHPTNRKQFFTK